MSEWWNGRHASLRCLCPHFGCAGSNPASDTRRAKCEPFQGSHFFVDLELESRLRAAFCVLGMTAWGRQALRRHGCGQPVWSFADRDTETSRLAGCRAKHVSWVSTPTSVRVALPRVYDICIQRRCRASSDDCVRMAARTRISPRRSNNRAFCIDGNVLSGLIQETVSNSWIARVCLPRSV